MKKILLFLGLILFIGLNSCVVSRKIVYLNDMDPAIAEKVSPMPPLRIQKNDRLSIHVSAKNPELAVPFNNTEGVYSTSDNGIVGSSNGNRGFLVDQQGNIDFPILGTLNIEGMTLDGLRDYLKDQLQTKNLLHSPVIKVELLNLKVLLMGEGGNKIISAPDSRLTILEAITQAGGLSNNANTEKIAVIREENGERKIYYNNIESKEIFNSSTYYLQQNDIVYVEPKAAVRGGNEARSLRIMSVVMSVLSMVTTIFALSK